MILIYWNKKISQKYFPFYFGPKYPNAPKPPKITSTIFEFKKKKKKFKNLKALNYNTNLLLKK